ncbi:HD domain-containing protein [Streptomyces sp. NPDC001941]|uniref:HD domain-containing protein n=1 Tax=Streptomyces sp. NPDC001941 TaxID=3154659 RepID=UPI0033207F6D
MSIPSVAQIRELHRAHAPSQEAYDSVHTHCEIVWRVAEGLLDRLGDTTVDRDLVRAGCLLHDIGVYRLYRADGTFDGAHYIRHGILGHEILREAGLPEYLCRFCSCHTGVGLTKDDIVRQDLPLPPGDYLAETAEERLVMYADKFHSKSRPPRFNAPATYSAYVRRFGADKTAAFEAMRDAFGDPELDALSVEFGNPIV